MGRGRRWNVLLVRQPRFSLAGCAMGRASMFLWLRPKPIRPIPKDSRGYGARCAVMLVWLSAPGVMAGEISMVLMGMPLLVHCAMGNDTCYAIDVRAVADGMYRGCGVIFVKEMALLLVTDVTARVGFLPNVLRTPMLKYASNAKEMATFLIRNVREKVVSNARMGR